MNFHWSSYRQLLPGHLNIGDDYLTLMEHEVPLLFVTSFLDKYYLNYFIDEDDDYTVRYLHVPVTLMQIRALVSDGLSLYDCLDYSGDIHIYDVRLDDSLSLTAQLQFADIPLEALPDRDENIPPLDEELVNDVFGFDTGELSFVLSGENTEDHTLSFDKLSNYLKKTQKLISESSLYREKNKGNVSAELRAVAMSPASFAIVAIATEDSVKKIISDFLPQMTRLFLNSTSAEIYDLLSSLPTKLISSFFDYYREILSNKYESIIKHGKGSLYLNHSKAEKIKKNINDANYLKTSERNVEGYLIGANLKNNSFQFEDIDGNNYKGKMSDDFVSSHKTITLSKTATIWKAFFVVETEIKFQKIIHSYELFKMEESGI